MKIIGEAYINEGDESVRIPVELNEEEYSLFKYHSNDEDKNYAWDKKEMRIINRIIKDTGINIDDYCDEYPVYEEGEYILSLKKKRC